MICPVCKGRVPENRAHPDGSTKPGLSKRRRMLQLGQKVWCRQCDVRGISTGNTGPGRGRNRDTAHPRQALRRRGIRSRSLLSYLGG